MPWRGPVGQTRAARPRRRRLVLVLAIVLVVVVAGAVTHLRRAQTVGAAITRLIVPPDVTAQSAPLDPDGPQPGFEESPAPLGVPPRVPEMPQGSGYQFIALSSTGHAVTWSPCRPIHYVVRTANEPAGGDQLLGQAIGLTSGATGLHFVSDGTTQEGPAAQRTIYQPARYGHRWAPVLIAWATPSEVADFAGAVAGEAGPVRVTTPTGGATYVSGTVYLDPAKFTQDLATQGPDVARTLILHELGHLVGLGHATDPQSVMYPTVTGRVTQYSLGDRVGLAALGRGPCQPGV